MSQKLLKRNIRLYGILKIFTKRVFLPITTVYLVTVAHLSIAQIGLLAAISAVMSLISEIPTGFLADKLSRKSALVYAGGFAAIATLVYAFAPSFHGAIIAVFFESLGYAFLNGPGEAIIHDTLVELDEVDNYPRVAGRAQSFGLIGNTILVLLAPLTYTISPKLPFLCGTLAYIGLMVVASLLYEPHRIREPTHHNPLRELTHNLKLFVNRYSIMLFVTLGIIGALNNTSGDFTNLIMKDQHLPTQLFGIVYASASVLGIALGYIVHLLRNLNIRTYAILDTLVFGGTLIVTGVGHSLPTAAGAFIVGMGWWRLRAIIYQHQLLKLFKNSAYKATLISVYAFFIRCNEVWLPFMFVAASKNFGFYNGYILIGSVAIILLVPSFVASTKLASKWQNA